MLHQIYAMAVKELKTLFRDPAVLGVLFLLPVIFVLIMTYAGVGNQTMRDAQIIVVNHDTGPIAARVIERLRQDKGLVVTDSIAGRPATEDSALPLVTRSGAEYALVLVFPADFSGRLTSPADRRPARVAFITDPVNGGQNLNPIERLIKIQAMAVAGAAGAGAEAEAVVESLAAKAPELHAVAQAVTQGLEGVDTRVQGRVEFERQAPPGLKLTRPLRAEEQNVPGYTIFGIFFIVQIIGGTLLREKEQGTFNRLMAAPISRPVILIGKLVPFYIVNLIQLLFMFAVGHLAFGISFGNSPLGLLLVTLATAAVANALGLFVAAISKTNEQMGPLSGVILVTLAAVGGIFIPYYEMPRLLQKVALLSPHSWALKGFQDILVRGYDLATALPTAGVLAAFATGFYLLALLRFRFV